MSVMFKRMTPRHLAMAGVGLFVLLIGMQLMLVIKKREIGAQDFSEHAIRTIDDVQAIVLKISDAKLAHNNYILTGDTRLLNFYYMARGIMKPSEKALKEYYADDRPVPVILQELVQLSEDDGPQRQETLVQFEALIKKELDYIAEAVSTEHLQSRDTHVQSIVNGHDQKIMEDIRIRASELVEQERETLHNKIIADELSDRRMDYYTGAVTLTINAALLIAIIMGISGLSRMRRTEGALTQSEAHFRAVAQGTLDALFLFKTVRDNQGEIDDFILSDINPAAQRMLSITHDEGIGKSVNAILPGGGNDMRESCKVVMSNGTPDESEYTAVSGPTAGRAFQQQIIPLPGGVAVMCRDITERKKIERMKNEFVSTVSHELRTPLTSIRGSLGLITGGIAGQISDQARNLLTIAYNNCERLVRLINDILDIEKIESGGMVLQLRAVPLLPTIRQLIETNRPYADKFQVGLTLDAGNDAIHSDEFMVTADIDRLAQVITNLLSNAIKFSSQGGEVTVRCSQAGGYARIEVQDHGQGIPDEFRTRIFEKFAQADSSDTRQKGGTGLGLSIVRALVQEMRGEIGFESVVGKGTTFYFTLPLVAKLDMIATLSPRETVQKQRILICEDEPDISHLLQIILERAGFTADIAPNAGIAKTMLTQRSYFAMTLDLALPDKDGIMLIKELRDDPLFAELPIVVVSVKAEEGKQELGGDAFGIVDWLKKPIDVNRLVHIVEGLYSTSSKPRILHVEDDNDIVSILRLLLQDMSEFVHAPDLSTAKAYLSSQDFTLAILDVNLPDGRGTDLLPYMIDTHGRPIPVVLFSAVEVPHEIGMSVAASLTKSLTSEQKLLDTIRLILEHKQPSMEHAA